MISRRLLFLTVPSVALVACSGTTGSTSLTVEQALADALSVASSLKTVLPFVTGLFPSIVTVPVSTLTGYLDAAINALTGLTSQSPTAITSLASAEQDINLVLNVLVGIAQVVSVADPAVAAIVLVIQAAIALSAPIESMLNGLLTPSATPSFRLGQVPTQELAKRVPAMAPTRARDVLRQTKTLPR